jgi:protein-tyrosine phosphatase
VAVRNLHWDGYINARDLGGLPTPLSPTGTTLFGRVARGPRRERLTADGWRDARQWGLATIVDLRCADEVGAVDGDPQIGPESTTNIAIVNAPTEDQDDPEFREVCFPILDSPEYWRHNWRILPKLVRGALHAIAESEPGVLVHCAAGRDRTGMISTLLLSNAGVSAQHISADYAESVRAMAGAHSHSPSVDRQASWNASEVESWIAETALIVEDVAADPDAAFRAIGVTPSVRSRLRSLLTGPSAGE